MPTRSLVRAALVLSLCGALAPRLSAQGTGRVVGRVVEGQQGGPVAGATVEVVGTDRTTVTAVDGRYILERIPAGTVSLRARMIGYGPKVVTGIVVPEGGSVAQDIALATEVVQLQEIAVTAEAERGTVNRALDEQRNATNIVSSITAEQIQKSPDSDAGQAVQRVSGVTVQDGRYVFVRGLGERYTTTSLNGARLPSPEPERKIVPLDLFPAGLLEGVTTSKTFTPDQFGDFSGASVNLKTREFPARRVMTFSVSGGLNGSATGKELGRAPRVGGEWLGFSNSVRDLPEPLHGVRSLSGTSRNEINTMIGSFRNSWSPSIGDGTANGGLGVTLGGEDPVFGQSIGYIGSFSYNYGQEVRDEEVRSLIQPVGSTGTFRPLNQSFGETVRNTVLWGGIANLSTRIGSGTKLSFNNTYNRTADNESIELAGDNEEFNTDLEVTRLTFVERAVRSHQLTGEHLLGERHLVDWSVSGSFVTRGEPDRSDLAYTATIDPVTHEATPIAWFGGPRSATRTFSDLDEDAWEGLANYRMFLGPSGNPVAVKVGAAYRAVDRTADSRPYDITNRGLSEADRELPPEQIFAGPFAEDSRFNLFINPFGGQYKAKDRLSAGYAQVEMPLTGRLRVIGGARLEHWELDLNTLDQQGRPSEVFRNNTDLLPALSLNYSLRENQVVRLSASQTLSRPEYREISNTSSFEPLGGVITFGDTTLQRALIQNYDLRWEWYPRSGEVLSVAAFAKRFEDPIERVFVNQTGALANSFRNAESAENYGVELEIRKNLDFLSAGFAPFTVFANTTLMHSDITPGSDVLTNANRPMVGQAEYVVNSGLTYSGPSGVNATALYNVVGSRIIEAGARPFPDSYEQARHIVDVSVQFPVFNNTSFRLDGKNLLDAPYRVIQGDILRWRYKAGRVVSFGATWSP